VEYLQCFEDYVSALPNGTDPTAIRANKLDLLERLAEDLAHEIKNPLHSMVINLEVLKRRISRAEAEGTADILRYVDVLGSELERVSHRIELLLQLVRPSRGGEPVPLDELVDELGELVELEALRRSVHAHFQPEVVGSLARVPREVARQVMLNLVLSVLDRLPPGSDLYVSLDQDGEQARVRVTGSPPAKAMKPGSTGAVGGPPGFEHPLPLSIAQALGEELGGYVEITDEPPTRSVVFSLPLRR
jgi:signal transduction histidine kinase